MKAARLATPSAGHGFAADRAVRSAWWVGEVIGLNLNQLL